MLAHGFTIKSGGYVHALLEPARHGRPGKTLFIGRVYRQHSQWRNDQCSDGFVTQTAAAKSLMRIIGR